MTAFRDSQWESLFVTTNEAERLLETLSEAKADDEARCAMTNRQGALDDCGQWLDLSAVWLPRLL